MTDLQQTPGLKQWLISGSISASDNLIYSLLLLTAGFLLQGCNSSTAGTTSYQGNVPAEKIADIKQQISIIHPNADPALQRRILELALRSIEWQVYIEGGRFLMWDFDEPCAADPLRPIWKEVWQTCSNNNPVIETGSLNNNNNHWPDTSPSYPIELNSYSLSKFETTIADSDTYRMAHNMPLASDIYPRKLSEYGALYPTLPAGTSNWQEAKDYCNWLGKLTRYAFDLPTEAQWEFAARNRGQNIYYTSEAPQGKNTGNSQYPPPPLWQANIFPVDMMPPNPLGIYAMQSNAAEWVDGWYDQNLNSPRAADSLRGSVQQVSLQRQDNGSKHRVLRGGLSSEYSTNHLIREQTERLPTGTYNPRFSYRCSIQFKAVSF